MGSVEDIGDDECCYAVKFYPNMHGHAPNTEEYVPDVDLRSDTVTKPTCEMRKAIFEAEVGDDGMREDPTVKKLEELCAKILKKEAALFVSSGTLSNLIAIMTHTDYMRSTDIIVGDKCHIVRLEQGGSAQIAGVTFNTVKNNPDGTFDLKEVAEKVHLDSPDVYYPKTALICVENTHNMCGGRIVPLKWQRQVVKYGKAHNIPLHMDGSRLFNAVVKSGISPCQFAEGFDSVNICLSKGLGAPIGSVLVGSEKFINRARRCRKVLGGTTRQAGIIAAAGVYALTHNIERLADDNRRAYQIAKAIADADCDIFKVNLEEVDTNILFIHLDLKKVTPDQFSKRMAVVTEREKKVLEGRVCTVRMFSMDQYSTRVTLHLDVSEEQVSLAIEKFKYVIKEFTDKCKN